MSDKKTFRGTLVTPFKVINDGQLELEGVTITYAGPRRTTSGKVKDYGDNIITPGFIDIHIHGGAGYDAMDPEQEALNKISEYLAGGGVTGFLATTQTAPLIQTLNALRRIRDAVKAGTTGAKLLGAHMEGPFISPVKKGAQRESSIRSPTINEIAEVLQVSDGALKIVTLAPEVEGAVEVIRWLADHAVVVSAGHTESSYEEACEAIDAGLSHMSHFFNGMRGFHHREPGVVGAGLIDDRVTVELVADGLHVHPAVLRLAAVAKGPSMVALVSDSIKPAGLPDGEYQIDGRTLILGGGLVKLPSGVIAGSSIRLNDAVRNMVNVGLPLSDAVQMATDTPARILGLTPRMGRLEPGSDADIVVMDQTYRVLETLVDGETVYRLSD
ncbi:MAG: N-acetylglucosamine-6-phosphate deacetylase [Candidatus Bathyarchaeota archaeon]|nr:N-acetylglucosamine-6-phosphate deacetylase [Candidatus Bathyarchaeota archaeon]